MRHSPPADLRASTGTVPSTWPDQTPGFDLGELETLDFIYDALLPLASSAWRASVSERANATALRHPNPQDVAHFRLFLKIIELPLVNLVLGGSWKRFSGMTRLERAGFLRAMAQHRLPVVRTGFQAMKSLATFAYYVDTDGSGSNPVLPTLGYPGPPKSPPVVPKPIQPLDVRTDLKLVCDAVVVGSGAGGGVVAGELASAGYDVVVVERGGYFTEADFTQREADAIRLMYLGSGMTSSDDLGIMLLAGSCLGGGTVVNATTSFRTPDIVRAEWARVSGLDFFEGHDLTRALDAVCRRLHVNQDHNRLSQRDELMAAGLQACGWHMDRMPRNVRGCGQDEVCGYCCFGCIRGAKQSMDKTYLKDAFERGARIVVNCQAEKVLIERGRAVGIAARTLEGHSVTVRSRVVVVAAGAINSPALLMRSGIGGRVGEHLHLHPFTQVWGYFDQEVRPWAGTLQAVYSDEFVDLDAGYGIKLETDPVHPLLLMGLGAAWEGPSQFDSRMRMLPHLSTVAILLRDRYGGRVSVNRSGGPVIHYGVSRYDQAHLRRGIEAAARVLLAAGAREVFTSQTQRVSYQPGRHESLEGWLARVDRVGYGANRMMYGSAHQMGTCRMGRLPAKSVANGEGETHALRNLYVADGSLFPSSSGVNPMITIAALAHYVAQQVKQRL